MIVLRISINIILSLKPIAKEIPEIRLLSRFFSFKRQKSRKTFQSFWENEVLLDTYIAIRYNNITLQSPIV